MLCRVCNKEIADGSKFCMFCGSSQEQVAPAEPVQPAPMPEQPVIPAEPVQPAPMPEQPVIYTEPVQPENPKPKKRLGLILGIVGGLAAIALIVLLVVSLGGGSNGPWQNISDAMMHTFEDGEFTFDLTLDFMGESGTIHGSMDIDMEERELDLYVEMNSPEETGITVIHDGYSAVYSNDPWYGEYWEYEDVRQDLQMVFLYLSQMQNSSAMMEDMDLTQLMMLTNPYAYEELIEIIDLDKLEEVQAAMERNYADEQWLAEYMGYSTRQDGKETVYRFDIDIFKLLEGTLITAKPAFKDPAALDQAMAELQRGAKEIGDLPKISMELRTRGNDLTAMGIFMAVDDEQVNILLEISDLDRSELDEDKLEAFLEEARRNS